MSSVDLLDGPLGIEAHHQWVAKDGTLLIRLGELTDLDVDPFYHYRVIDIAGLFDFPEMDDNSESATESYGAVAYPSRARTKNVTYTVDVRAKNLQFLRRGSSALRQAFGPDITTGLVPLRTMIITPHPSYGTAEHAFSAKCLQLSQGTDVQDRGPSAVPTAYVRRYTIGLKLYDPRLYTWNPDSEFGFATPKW